MSGKFQHAGTPNLYTKDGIYYYRRQMTGPIYKCLGMSEIRRSLKTGNIKEARLRCAYIDLKLKQILGKAEQLLSENNSPEALEIARDFFKRELQSYLDEYELAPHLEAVTGNKLGFDPEYKASSIPKSISTYKKMAASKDFSPDILFHVDQGFEDNGLVKPSKNSNEYRQLGTLICRAKIEVLRIYHSHLTGDFGHVESSDHLFKDQEIMQAAPIIEDNTISLKSLLDYHKEANEDIFKPGTKDDYKRIYKWVLEWFGEEVKLHKIPKVKIRAFRDMLKHMPTNYSKFKVYNKLALPEVIEKSKKKNESKTIDPVTQEKYFGLYKAILNWAVTNDYIDASLATKIVFKKPNKTSNGPRRLPFGNNELTKLLASSIFTGYEHPSRRSIKGSIMKQLPEYWCWLIALHSGLRIKEIIMLRCRDIVEENGVLCFDVNNKHGIGVKSNAGIRQVPIHKNLLEFGLMKWVSKKYQREAK